MAAIVLALALPTSAAATEVAPGVVWTQIVREAGPVRINVLELDPALVHGVLSNNRIAGRERVSRMGRRVGAVAGVNGGYWRASGDPVGVLAIDGTLLSEPLEGRTALVMDAGRAGVGSIRFSGSVTINGVERLIDGVERTRGLIPGCGGRGGDVPTTRPNAVLTCTDASELVLLSPRYGARPPREGGVEAVLRDAALPRSRAAIQLTLSSGRRPLALGEQSLVVGAGPRLLRRGHVAVTARAEGFAPPQAPAFYGTFVAARQPRTLAGVREDGRLLLVTVDGRRPGWSTGMTLPEAARLMRSLGAREALNLDGGGSSTMTVRGEVVNRPSDPGGERRVSNGVYALP